MKTYNICLISSFTAKSIKSGDKIIQDDKQGIVDFVQLGYKNGKVYYDFHLLDGKIINHKWCR